MAETRNEIRFMLNHASDKLARDVQLYAAEMAGIPRVAFLDLYTDYEIPLSQIAGDDLHREMANA